MTEEKIFSNKTLRMLEDNGYVFKQKENFISFKHSSSDRIGLVLIGILLLFASFILLVISNVVVLVSVDILLIIGLTIIGKRMAGKSLLMFDTRDKTFFYKIKNGPSVWHPIHTISEIIQGSKFISEYTSPFKNTNEEYQITISLRLDSEKMMTIFKFMSDFQEPSIQVKEVFNWIESTIKETNIKSDHSPSRQTSVSG